MQIGSLFADTLAPPGGDADFMMRSQEEIARANAERLAGKIAMREKDFGIWQAITWREYFEQGRLIALGLASLGFRRGDKVAIIGDNRPQLYWAVLATQAILYSLRNPRIIDTRVREEMKRVLSDIRDGTHAKKWIAENEAGRPWFNAERKAERSQEGDGRGDAEGDPLQRQERRVTLVHVAHVRLDAHRRERPIDRLPLQGQPRVRLGGECLLPSRSLAIARQDLPHLDVSSLARSDAVRDDASRSTAAAAGPAASTRMRRSSRRSRQCSGPSAILSHGILPSALHGALGFRLSPEGSPHRARAGWVEQTACR